MTHERGEQPSRHDKPVNPDELGPAQPRQVDQPGGDPLAPEERGRDHRPEDERQDSSKEPGSR